MRPSDFFIEVEDPQWDLHGRDPWNRLDNVLNINLLEKLRRQKQIDIEDVDAAYGLAKLAHEELYTFGASSENPRLDDEQLTLLIRALRSTLKRVGISFDPPFRDFKGFHGYWSAQGMSGGGGWAARRGYLNELFNPIYSSLDTLDDERASTGAIRGVDGELRNLIFASTGPKPEIILKDAINNIVEVTKNAEFCLFYDRSLTDAGLTWGSLVDWWRMKETFDKNTKFADVARSLYGRLFASVKENPVERILFRTYCERYGSDRAAELPALIPQVYLHYDPLTRTQRAGRTSFLMRERMDFLLLLPRRIRIVLEIDGKQHYADGSTASPRLYSEMMAEDRRLRLGGYEVYRFGGYELVQPGAADLLRKFFDDLLEKYPT
ncbi:hypothetical protein ACIGNX_25325 [Actinosynnema sp. NPDC053489]|uniref:hypothetical protein n=1 Tax=Actinosynnema sp. NPDC053489 TaxID=3363916 RepID=UPI0037CB0F76